MAFHVTFINENKIAKNTFTVELVIKDFALIDTDKTAGTTEVEEAVTIQFTALSFTGT